MQADADSAHTHAAHWLHLPPHLPYSKWAKRSLSLTLRMFEDIGIICPPDFRILFVSISRSCSFVSGPICLFCFAFCPHVAPFSTFCPHFVSMFSTFWKLREVYMLKYTTHDSLFSLRQGDHPAWGLISPCLGRVIGSLKVPIKRNNQIN